MDDDWDTPSPAVQTANSGFGDGGVAFGGKGRGFSPKTSTSRPGGDYGSNGYSKKNDDWGDQGEWGASNNGERRGGGGGRGRGGRGGGRGGSRGGFRNEGNDESWGGNDNEGGEFGGGRRGGRSRNFNSDGDSWNRQDDGAGSGGGDRWGADEDGGRGGRGRGRGRGRGGRGGGGGRGRDDDEGGADEGGFGNDGTGEPEKPREIYVPPDPTTDENEMFSGITTGINFAKYDDIEVNVSGENCPKPIRSFEDAGLRPLVMDNIKRSGYLKPTPIQKHSIPIIMAGRDLMACAQTGSGKTAAFLLPIINTLLEQKTELVSDGVCAQPQVVIISPTRELAIQIFEQGRKFAHGSILKIVITYGGTSTNHQRGHVQNGCHILVATPGRMHDFVKRGHISFASTRFVVLDEADRMLDMGFLPTVEEMMDNENMTPTGERRTLMFSATFPEEIQRLAAKFLHDYIFVTVGIVGGACTDIEQIFHQVDKFKKRSKLLEILREAGDDRTLVFVETKRNADFLATFLSENQIKATSIHGDRQQRERETALKDFKTGFRNILVATGVAARGLDIENVKHVINFDLPKSIDEYVHRIGRTGRVGNRGKATSFFDDSVDGPLQGDLSRILKQAGQVVPDWMRSGGGGSFQSSGFGGVDVRGDFGQSATLADEPVEEW